jgi:hypothetical protein
MKDASSEEVSIHRAQYSAWLLLLLIIAIFAVSEVGLSSLP